MQNKNKLLVFKFFVTLLVLCLYLSLSNIGLYGIDYFKFHLFLKETPLEMLPNIEMYYGGFISKMSIIGLNIIPFLMASLIVTVFTLLVPFFKHLKETSQQELINKYIYFFTFILGIIQGTYILLKFYKMFSLTMNTDIITVSVYLFVPVNTFLLLVGIAITLFLINYINSYILQNSGIAIILIINISYYHLYNLSVYASNKDNYFLVVILLYLLLIFLLIRFYTSMFTLAIHVPFLTYFYFTSPLIFRNHFTHVQSTYIIPYDLFGISSILIYNLSTSLIFGSLNSGWSLIFYKMILFFTIFYLFLIYSFSKFDYFKLTKKMNVYTPLLKTNIKNFLKFIITQRLVYFYFLIFLVLFIPEIVSNLYNLNYFFNNYSLLSLFILVRLLLTLFYNVRT